MRISSQTKKASEGYLRRLKVVLDGCLVLREVFNNLIVSFMLTQAQDEQAVLFDLGLVDVPCSSRIGWIVDTERIELGRHC
jgi:hypothetical protein